MTRTKLLALLGIIAAIVYCYVEAAGEGDFFIFMWAAGKLDGHTIVYTIKYIDSYNYFYSILFALLLKPFYYLPFFGVKFCWLMLNLFLYVLLFRLLAQAPFLNALEKRQRNVFLLAVFLFSFRFLHENIHASQITILILWCCVYGMYWIITGKTVAGSLVLAMGINIKLLPIVLIPYLLYRGYYKAFFITITAYACSLLVPGIFIGTTYNFELLKAWFDLVNPTSQRHVLDVDERSFHSLTTLLSTLFHENVPDMYAMPLKRNIAHVSLETLKWIIMLVRLALITFTLWFLKLQTIGKKVPTLLAMAELSYIFLLVPLIFPHQQHYAFLFTVPAFAFVVFTWFSAKSYLKPVAHTIMAVALWLVYIICNLKLLLGEYNHYYEHFKILTYGALALIPLLAWASRYKQFIKQTG